MRLTQLAAWSLCLVACGGEASNDPDASGIVVHDAAQEAPPPVCEGTPVPCSEHALDACGDVPGCAPSAECTGFGTPCGGMDRGECASTLGCRWEMDLYCAGTAASCTTYGTELQCRNAGCDWVLGDACGGAASACASLDAVECGRAPGCRPIGADGGGAPDAGGDPSTRDAGAPDAGADCSPLGSSDCHPYFDADCGCAYSTSDTRFGCGRAGSIPEGGRCDDFGECASGLICHRGRTGDEGECRRRCVSDGECGGSEVCAFRGYDAPCAGFCVPLAECRMDLQDCPSGEGCYLVVEEETERLLSFCHPAGSVAAGDNCFTGSSLSCEPGLLCAQDPLLTFSEHCQPLCTSDADCDALSDCTGMTGGFMHCE